MGDGNLQYRLVVCQTGVELREAVAPNDSRLPWALAAATGAPSLGQRPLSRFKILYEVRGGSHKIGVNPSRQSFPDIFLERQMPESF